MKRQSSMLALFPALMVLLGLVTAGSAKAEPCALRGGVAAIEIHHSRLVADGDWLGPATTEPLLVPRGDGCFRVYQNTSIYWSLDVGAYEVHGDIRSLWGKFGWEQSILGYPTTDETSTPDGIGRFNHFQNGSIYWTPRLGATVVINGFRAYWGAHGWERNPALGYPVSSEFPSVPAGPDRYQTFENGVPARSGLRRSPRPRAEPGLRGAADSTRGFKVIA